MIRGENTRLGEETGREGRNAEEEEKTGLPQFDEGDIRNSLMDSLEAWFNPAGRVCNVVAHEMLPPAIHLHVHEPSEAFPFYTLVTEGLSTRPMPVPAAVVNDWGEEALVEASRAEFVVYLRKRDVEQQLREMAEGPKDSEGQTDQTKAKETEEVQDPKPAGPPAAKRLPDVSLIWQADMVRRLAHWVQDNNLWVWEGHTLATNDEQFSHFMLTPIYLFDNPENQVSNAGDNRPQAREEVPIGVVPPTRRCPRISLFALVPLTPEEMQFKREHGGYAALRDFIGDRDQDPENNPISFFMESTRESAHEILASALESGSHESGSDESGDE